MNFTTLGLFSPFVKNLSGRGITEASEIQQAVIPLVLGKTEDEGPLLFTAPTGTGKTLAYLLPVLSRLFKTPESGAVESGGRNSAFYGGPLLLILAPTHELCIQIKGELDLLLKVSGQNSGYGGIRQAVSVTLIGSVSLSRQIESLKKNKPLAAVGNPARVLQLLHMKKLSLKALQWLVLDEGDRLMADELFPETEELCAEIYPGRNSLKPGTGYPELIACSATFSGKNRERLFRLGKKPEKSWKIIEENKSFVLQHNIEHWAFFAEDRKKIALLRSFLAAVKPKKVLVFSSRGGQLGNIVSQLQFHHLAAGGIRGDMDKRARKAAMEGFRKGSLKIMAATDLACRGLDIEGISHVIALDVPDNAEAYLHRAGRTGRAGKHGIMVSIGNEDEMRRLARIEKTLGITVYPKELYGGRIMAPEL
jgi:superfamily II DNA/RNA helicase